MSLPGTTLRRRRVALREIVQNLDGFTKTTDEVKEEKSASGGILSGVCFIIIVALVYGQVKAYLYSEAEYEYKFTVDTAYDEQPELEMDMIIATPCTNLVAQLSGTASQQFNLMNEFKRDPTRFEFTDREQFYWNELKKAHGRTKPGASVFKGIERMTFVSDQVERGLKSEAEEKQREEAFAIEQEKLKNPNEGPHGGAILFIGNGVNVFHIIASDSLEDEGTACRVHGRVRVNKVKGDSVIVSTGKGLSLEGLFVQTGMGKRGNTSHRIERFNFGPRIGGLVTPLAGTEQISESGADEYRYFLKVVPTLIFHNGLFGGSTMTYQYSVTFTKKSMKDEFPSNSGIAFHYEFAATVIEVRQLQTSILQLLVRLCSAVGGVFATSAIIDSLFSWILRRATSAHRVAPSENGTATAFLTGTSADFSPLIAT